MTNVFYLMRISRCLWAIQYKIWSTTRMSDETDEPKRCANIPRKSTVCFPQRPKCNKRQFPEINSNVYISFLNWLVAQYRPLSYHPVWFMMMINHRKTVQFNSKRISCQNGIRLSQIFKSGTKLDLSCWTRQIKSVEIEWLNWDFFIIYRNLIATPVSHTQAIDDMCFHQMTRCASCNKPFFRIFFLIPKIKTRLAEIHKTSA